MPTQCATQPGFGNVARQMNKMMDQLQKGYFSFRPNEVWAPPVNLYETDGAYLVCVDLAGVDKEKIELEVVENQLRLRGHRAAPAPPDSPPTAVRLRVHLMEIDHGAFAREVELPEDVARDRIEASYNVGMLWIRLPKK